MKKLIVGAMVAVMSVAMVVPGVADAKRFGGGGSSGMSRSVPSQGAAPMSAPARPAAPTNAAAPAGATAAAAAAAPKRSWMGPIAGIAAGLGIAALMSHLGMGAGFGNLITMLLIAGVAFFAIRFLMRKFAGGNAMNKGNLGLAGAGAQGGSGFGGMANGNGGASAPAASPFGMQRTAATEPAFGTPFNTGAAPVAAGVAAGASASSLPLPADFDAPGFERIAKMIFIRMQTANDARDLDDLRQFTTPEMFASARVDLQDRGTTEQKTDVVQLNAQVLDVAKEADRQIVSVRYHGLIREEQDAGATPFDEVWHLVKPVDGSREWAIAGVQQMA
jgi:predicted lipid-binding transport protein (Tim44 family)